MIAKIVTIATIACLMALTAPGCGARAPDAGQAAAEASRRHKISIEHPDLNAHISSAEIANSTARTGHLRPAISILVGDVEELPVEYQVTFYDGAGRQVDQTNWIPKRLVRGVNAIECIATHPRAVDCGVELRRPAGKRGSISE